MSLPLTNEPLSRSVDVINSPPRLSINPNNYRYFKQTFVAYAKRNLPEVGTAIQTNVYPAFTDPPNPGGAQASMEQRIYFEEVKDMRMRQRKFHSETRPAGTGAIVQCLSEESLLLVKSDQTFDNIYAANDFLALWRLIESKHVAGNGRPEQIIHREIRVLENLNQGNKPLRLYAADYSMQMEKLIYLGNNPDGPMAASRFLFSLDPKFARKVNEILSSPNPPQTVAEAKNLIVAYDDNQSSVVSLMNNRLSRNVAKDENVNYSQHHSRSTTSSSEDNKSRSSTSPQQFAQRRSQEENDEFHGTTSNTSANTDNKKCKWCNKLFHTAQTCRALERYMKRHPNAATSDDDTTNTASSNSRTNGGGRSRSSSRSKSPSNRSNGSSRSKSPNNKKSSSFPSYMYPSVHFSDDDGDDNDNNDDDSFVERSNVAVVTEDNNDVLPTTTDVLCLFQSTSSIVDSSAVSSSTTTFTLMLDTGSTVHVVNDKILLSDMSIDPKKEIVIHGINSNPTRTHTKGTFSIFGDAYFVSDLPFCILSYSRLSKLMKNTGGNIKYSSDSDSFIISFNSHSLSFKRDKNLYLCHVTYSYLSSLVVNYVSSAHQCQSIVDNYAFPSKARTIKIADSGEFISQERRANAVAARKVHEMLGHPSDSVLGPALDNGVYRNLSLTSQALADAEKVLGRCTGCDLGKFTRPSDKTSVSPPIVKIASMLHMDIYFCTGDADRKEPYLVCVTESGGMLYSIHLESKSAQKLLDGIMSIVYDLHSYGHQVDTIRTDREAVFVSLSQILSAVGIHMEFASPDQHEKKAERMIRVIKERIRCILHSLLYTLPRSMYKYLNEFVVSCINMVPNTQSGNQSPYGLITKKIIDAPLSLKARFGEFVMCRVPTPSTSQSFEARAEFGIVIGRDLSMKGSIKVFLLHSNEVVTRYAFNVIPPTQDLIRIVNDLAAKSSSVNIVNDPLFASNVVDPISLCDINAYVPSRVGSLTIPTRPIIEIPNTAPLPPPVENNAATLLLPNHISSSLSNNNNTSNNNDATSSFLTPPPAVLDVLSSSPPHQLQSDYRGDVVIGNSDAMMDTVSFSPTLNQHDVSIDDPSVIVTPSPLPTPSTTPTYSLRSRDALSNWKTRKTHDDGYVCFNLTIKKAEKLFPKSDCDKANKSELVQLMEMGAFAPLSARDYRRLFDKKKNPKKFRILPCHMFLKAKYNASGKFDKLKSRLVAGGNMQEELDDFERTSPTAQISSLLTVAGIAAKYAYHVVTADVKGAYLNASLPTDNQHLMRFPSSLVNLLIELDPTMKDCVLPDGTIVVKLVKALYGLQESARLWYETIASTLVNDLKFSRSDADGCIFVCGNPRDGNHSIIVLYVDDLFICCQHKKDIERILSSITRKYKDLNVCSNMSSISYLGMEFKFDMNNHCVSINQSGYVGKILESYPNLGTSTSPATNDLLIQDTDESNHHDGNVALSVQDQKQYVSLLMKLMYLAKRSRPDILMPISYLATKSHGATVNDFNKLFRVLKYVNGTKELGLTLAPSSLELNCFIDASFAIHSDAKSHTGIVVSLGGDVISPVAVFSKKQSLTTKSSFEAELVALDEGVTTLVWFQRLMDDLSYSILPSIIYQDNQSTIHVARHGTNGSRRTRHINVRYFYVKEHLDTGKSIVKYLPTNDMIADLLTKPFTGSRFRELRNKLLNSILLIQKK